MDYCCICERYSPFIWENEELYTHTLTSILQKRISGIRFGVEAPAGHFCEMNRELALNIDLQGELLTI
jgi:hypothetical protein